MMNNGLHNKMKATQDALKDALNTLKNAQGSAMKNADQLLSAYDGEHKKMLTQEMTNIRKSMKTADAKELQRINQRIIELIKKCQ